MNTVYLCLFIKQQYYTNRLFSSQTSIRAHDSLQILAYIDQATLFVDGVQSSEFILKVPRRVIEQTTDRKAPLSVCDQIVMLLLLV